MRSNFIPRPRYWWSDAGESSSQKRENALTAPKHQAVMCWLSQQHWFLHSSHNTLGSRSLYFFPPSPSPAKIRDMGTRGPAPPLCSRNSPFLRQVFLPLSDLWVPAPCWGQPPERPALEAKWGHITTATGGGTDKCHPTHTTKNVLDETCWACDIFFFWRMVVWKYEMLLLIITVYSGFVSSFLGLFVCFVDPFP